MSRSPRQTVADGHKRHMPSKPIYDALEPGTVDIEKREKEILRLMIEHGSISAVATAIGLSERHTRRLIRNLQDRVGVDNTHALVVWAVLQGPESAADRSPQTEA